MSLEISTDFLLAEAECRWKFPPTFYWQKQNVVENFNWHFTGRSKMSVKISTDSLLAEAKCRWKFPPTVYLQKRNVGENFHRHFTGTSPIEPKSTGNYEELLSTLVVHFSFGCLSQSLNRLLQLRASGKPVRFCTFKKALYFISYLSSVVLSSPDVFVNYVNKQYTR